MDEQSFARELISPKDYLGNLLADRLADLGAALEAVPQSDVDVFLDALDIAQHVQTRAARIVTLAASRDHCIGEARVPLGTVKENTMDKATRLLAAQGHLPRWFGAVVSCVRCGQQAKNKRAIIWAGM
eukprot:1125751-Prorocentrum_lima.AAC.1